MRCVRPAGQLSQINPVLIAATFQPVAISTVVDQDSPHRLGRSGEENGHDCQIFDCQSVVDNPFEREQWRRACGPVSRLKGVH